MRRAITLKARVYSGTLYAVSNTATMTVCLPRSFTVRDDRRPFYVSTTPYRATTSRRRHDALDSRGRSRPCFASVGFALWLAVGAAVRRSIYLVERELAYVNERKALETMGYKPVPVGTIKVNGKDTIVLEWRRVV
jgi:hypothetical protein